MKDQDILDRINKAEESYRLQRFGYERDWYRNLLYKQGMQWIVWDAGTNVFKQKTLAPWIPMPVTNRFASTLDALVALVLRVEPPLQWSPQDETNEIQRTQAETANAVVEAIKESTGFQFWRQILATWLIYTGNGWIFNMYDPSGGSTKEIPYMACQTCGYEALPDEFEGGCPECEGQELDHAIDGMGNVKVEQMKGGEIVTEVGSPFEAFFDFQHSSTGNIDEILRIRHRPLKYFQRYGKQGREVQATESTTLAEYYQAALAYASSWNNSFGKQRQEGTTEKVYMCLPNDDFPDGIYAVSAGGVLLEKSALIDKNLNGEYFLPYVHIKADEIPGSGIGKTVATDLAPKQKQRNEIESLIQLIITRMGNPVWIVPHGIDVDEFSGEPGFVMKTFMLTPGSNGGPVRLAGENVPSSIMQYLDKIDADFEEISSVYDSLKGKAPEGVSAGYALQLLDERGMSRWGPLFQRWENGFVQWGKQITAMARNNMPALQLRALLGEHGDWEMARFKEESMEGFKMKMEASALRPRSALTEQAQAEQAIQRGLINIQDPTLKAKLLRNMGLSRYDFDTDWDIKDAKREEQGFLKIAQMADSPDEQMAVGATRFRPQIDNHFIHIVNHRRFAKTDGYMKLSAGWQALWLEHLAQHQMMVMQQMGMGQSSSPMGSGSSSPSPEATSPFDSASSKGGRKMNPIAQEGPGVQEANPISEGGFPGV